MQEAPKAASQAQRAVDAVKSATQAPKQALDKAPEAPKQAVNAAQEAAPSAPSAVTQVGVSLSCTSVICDNTRLTLAWGPQSPQS